MKEFYKNCVIKVLRDEGTKDPHYYFSAVDLEDNYTIDEGYIDSFLSEQEFFNSLKNKVDEYLGKINYSSLVYEVCLRCFHGFIKVCTIEKRRITQLKIKNLKPGSIYKRILRS